MDSTRTPSSTSWEGLLRVDSPLKHLIIKQQLTDSSLTFSGARQGQGSGSYWDRRSQRSGAVNNNRPVLEYMKGWDSFWCLSASECWTFAEAYFLNTFLDFSNSAQWDYNAIKKLCPMMEDPLMEMVICSSPCMCFSDVSLMCISSRMVWPWRAHGEVSQSM